MATTTTRPSATARSANGQQAKPDPKLTTDRVELQRFGTLRQLPIGLPAEARARAASC